MQGGYIEGFFYTAMNQTLSEIKAALEAWGLRPKHRLGQNFLHDANQMSRIIQAARLNTGDLVLEVGPGTGALSQQLLNIGARLVAVELDRDLEPILRDHLSGHDKQTTLIIADVLAGKHTINPDVVAALHAQSAQKNEPQPDTHTNFKLIANLPYNVASPLLANLTMGHTYRLCMTDAVVMIQREVANRLTAAPGNKDYGALGVLIQAVYNVERIGVVGPNCFWPRPKVESAIVRLTRRDQPLTDNLQQLSTLTHRLFTHRRKQLGAILGRQTVLPDGIDPKTRPEQLSVEQLVTLAGCLIDY